MAWLHMHHRVQDYNQWKAAFDKTDSSPSLRRSRWTTTFR